MCNLYISTHSFIAVHSVCVEFQNVTIPRAPVKRECYGWKSEKLILRGGAKQRILTVEKCETDEIGFKNIVLQQNVPDKSLSPAPAIELYELKKYSKRK